MEKVRDNKGRFRKGISGNPTGKCKDGSVPVQDAPATEARELVSLVTKQEEVIDALKKIYLDNAVDLFEKAIERAKTNDKILSILVEPLARQLTQSTQPQHGARLSLNKNQLELELFETMREAGMRVEQSQRITDGGENEGADNRFASVSAPAHADPKNAG
jgi:hypothetical protein